MDICESCGREKQMYYTEWCPYCDKPQIKHHRSLNLIKCLRYIESALNKPGYKDEMWSMFCDYGYIEGNDTFMTICFEDDWVESEEEKVNMELLRDTFDLKNNVDIMFEVSW